MVLPDIVKIGVTAYAVHQAKGAYLLDTRCSAIIQCASQTITVDGDMAVDTKNVSFLHEVVHGMMYELGLDEHDEKLVDGLAHQLYQLIQQNPAMFREG